MFLELRLKNLNYDKGDNLMPPIIVVGGVILIVWAIAGLCF